MVAPPKHPKVIILSRKTHGCWVPLFSETSNYSDFHDFSVPGLGNCQKTDCGRSLTLGAAALSGAAEAGPREPFGGWVRGAPLTFGSVYLAPICHLVTRGPGKRSMISFYRCKRHLNKIRWWFEAHFPKWVGWIWCGLFLGGFVLSHDIIRSHRIILVGCFFLARTSRIGGSNSRGYRYLIRWYLDLPFVLWISTDNPQILNDLSKEIEADSN